MRREDSNKNKDDGEMVMCSVSWLGVEDSDMNKSGLTTSLKYDAVLLRCEKRVK